MEVHCAAGLQLHRLGHEGRIDAVLQRHLTDKAFEDDDLVGQLDRVAMVEIDLELGGAAFVDHGVEVKRRRFGIFVNVLDDVFVFSHRLETIGLWRGLGSARSAGRRQQREVGISIDLGEVKLELWRDQDLPADRVVKAESTAQHVAPSDFERLAALEIGVGDYKCGRGLEPRRDAQQRRIAGRSDASGSLVLSGAAPSSAYSPVTVTANTLLGSRGNR